MDRRVRLIVDVARALHHAHTKGLIHRDIKPSNLLVTVKDETHTVKVIDFGITKAVGQRLTEKTLHTQVDEFVGTPEYMSPEQAGFGGVEVDVRTDIYSVGVVLYELLSGTRPSDIERVSGLGLGELHTSQKPLTPSAHVTSLDSRKTIAGLRDTTAAGLRSELEGGLDQVVTKAMAMDRTHRYDTARPSAIPNPASSGRGSTGISRLSSLAWLASAHFSSSSKTCTGRIPLPSSCCTSWPARRRPSPSSSYVYTAIPIPNGEGLCTSSSGLSRP